MPGHIKHKGGDTFSEVYLSYHGRIPATCVDRRFAPDEKFQYVRGQASLLKRFLLRLSHSRPENRRGRPLAGGHDARPGRCIRGLVSRSAATCCMIEEFGGGPIRARRRLQRRFRRGLLRFDRGNGADLR